MGIGRQTPKPRASGMKAFSSGRRVSAKDAEAYAKSKQPKRSPFAKAKRAGGRK